MIKENIIICLLPICYQWGNTSHNGNIHAYVWYNKMEYIKSDKPL